MMSESIAATATTPATEVEQTSKEDPSQDNTPMQTKKQKSDSNVAADTPSNAATVENNTKNNTSPTALASAAAANSPKSLKPKRNANSAPRGGSAPKSSSTRVSENGKKPTEPNTASSAAGTIGLGVVSGERDDMTSKSNGNNNTEAESRQQQSSQNPSAYSSRKGRAPHSQSSQPSETPPASTSGARFTNSRGGYSSRGRDDDNIRGRRWDNRYRSGPGGSPSAADSNGVMDVSATDLARPPRERGSPGTNDARKSGFASRTPHSPRSPRRGFGERVKESRNSATSNKSAAQDASTISSPPPETVSSAPQTPSTVAVSTSPPKTRKPARKNRNPDDDEVSVASVGSAKGSDNTHTTEGKGSSKPSGGRGSRADQLRQQQYREWKNDGSMSSRQRGVASRDTSTSDWRSKTTQETVKNKDNESQRWGHPSATSATNPADGWGQPAVTSVKWGEEMPWEKPSKKDSPAKAQAAPKSKTPKASEKNEGDLKLAQGGWGEPPGKPSTPSQSGWGAPPNANLQRGQEALTDKGVEKDVAASSPAATTRSKSAKAQQKKDDITAGGGRGEARDTVSTTNENDGWGQPANSNVKWGEELPWDKDIKKKDASAAKSQGSSGPRTSNRTERRESNPVQSGWEDAPEPVSNAGQSDGWGQPTVSSAKWGGELPWEKSDKDTSSAGPTATPMKATPNKAEKKETSSAQSGWGDAPGMDSTTDTTDQADGWGQPVVTTVKWGEDVPWEQLNAGNKEWRQDLDGDASNARGSTGAKRDSRFDNSRQGYGGAFAYERTGAGQGRFGGRSGDSRFGGPPQHGYQRDRMQDERYGRKFQDSDSASRSQDARSSLDARKERLGSDRGPRSTARDGSFSPSEKDPASEQTSSGDWERSKTTTESSWDSTKQRAGFSADSKDVRLESHFNNTRGSYGRSDDRPYRGQRTEAFSGQHGQSYLPSSPVSDKSLRGSPAGRDKSDTAGQGRKGRNVKDGRTAKAPGQAPLPMFSDSLECQMTWDEMDLRPNVLASIAKAGLTKPSNIQKLVMKPFKEGKDVIAQSQSQKDRTNTLAIALLQKLSPAALTQKHCKAVMICSDGINPQRVHEDLQGWFETTPGLSTILLSSDSTVEKQQSVLADSEQAKQVVITTLGPLMEVLRNDLLDMKQVETVVISMRSDELVNFDAFKQFWAMLPKEAQVILMTGRIQPQIQMIKTHHFRADAAVRRADELTMQWSEHYFVDIERQHRKRTDQEQRQDDKEEVEEQGEGSDPATVHDRDHKWEVLMEILGKNPDISHIVILTQSQSLTQSLTTKLEEQNLPVLSVWSMADKTEVARQFNRPERCILVSESILMENLDLDHSSLVINYEMPKRAWHYISSFGPFGRSGLRTLMINFCVTEDSVQMQTLENIESLYDIKVKEMELD
ncbi:Eukaryotic initiation factor 4A-III [Mortierella sp. GBA30]|nr:Eukaryotic initiation factor 4A-III [Mortierella sp. GBA30]